MGRAPKPAKPPKHAKTTRQTGPSRRERRAERSGGRHRGPVAALVVSLVVLLAMFGGALAWLRPSPSGRQLSLDAVLRAATEERVKTARLLDEDSLVTGTLMAKKGGPATPFTAAYPQSDAATNDLVRALYAGKARITVDAQPTKRLVRFVAQFLFPLVILANLFALLFYLTRSSGGGTGGLRAFGRLGDKKVRAKGAVTFANVAAVDGPITELAEVRDYLADPSAFQKMGVIPPKGVLLMGPPGCGKTLLARAVAGEAAASFFSVSGSEFVESLVGIGAARVRDLFAQARAAAPSILFIDELDAVGRQRGAGIGGGHDEREQTLNELLVQMDGFSPSDGVVLMGATNRPDILDSALLRPGRFDRQVTVEKPDVEGRLAILRLHAGGKPLADAAGDLPAIAAATPGFSGADLASLVNEAGLLAVRERATSITHGHLDEAVDRVMSGPKKRGMLLLPADKRRIAVHEGGHAIAAAALGKAGPLDKLSIVARGRGLGHLSLLDEDTVLPTRSDMRATVTIALAGIAAEELVFGEPSVGSESDLGRATTIARDMAGRYGMSARLGRMRVLHEEREVFLGRDYLLTKEVSQPTLEHLDAEIRTILDEQEAVARLVLESHRSLLDELVEQLVAYETLKGDTLRRALDQVERYVPAGANGSGPAKRPRRRSPAAVAIDGNGTGRR